MALLRMTGFEAANSGEMSGTLGTGYSLANTPLPTGGGGRVLKNDGSGTTNVQIWTNLQGAPAIPSADGAWFTTRFRIDSATAPAVWSYWGIFNFFDASGSFNYMGGCNVGQAPIGSGADGQFTIYWSNLDADRIISFCPQITSGNWVELKLFVSTTAVKIWVNGTLYQYSGSGVYSAVATSQMAQMAMGYNNPADAARPHYHDDYCAFDSDPGSVPFIIARQFASNGTNNAWTTVGGANKFSNVSETPFSATNGIVTSTANALQDFNPNSFSATETGKGSGVITSGTHTVLGAKISLVAKTSATTSSGNLLKTRWVNSSAAVRTWQLSNLTTADLYHDLNGGANGINNSAITSVNGAGIFVPSSVADLNGSQFGVDHDLGTRTKTVEDIWVHAAFAAGEDARFAITETSDTVAVTIAARHTASLDVTETSDAVSISTIVPTSISFSITETSDTVAATITARHTASLAATETADTVAATITAAYTASLAVTETSDTVAATITARHTLSLAVTETADTVVISVDPIQRITFAFNESSDTAAATITAAHTASLTVTETSDTAAATLTARHTAALAVTETSDAVLFYLAVGNFGFINFAITEPADTVAVTVEPSKLVTFAVTETADTVAATIAARHTASLAATESADTVAVSLAARHVATLAVTETSDTASADLSAFWAVSFAITEPADTAAASVDVFHVAVLDATEAADLVAASANVKDLLSLALLEASDTTDFYVAKTGWGFLSSENMVWDDVNAGSPGWVEVPSSPSAWTPVVPS